MHHINDLDRLCRCGCGQPAPLATRTNRPRGQAKGEPLAYIAGHNRRASTDLTRWELVDTGHETPCMLWTGPLTHKGYGRATIDGVHHHAHRAVWLAYVDDLDADEHLDHLCRQKACVNPDHLEVVDAATNNRRTSRLTDEDVAAIRAADGSQADIAARFGVSRQYVSDIQRGARAADCEGVPA